MFAVSIILRIFVLVRRAVILVAFMALSLSLGNACTCGPNYTPVQRTDERYAEKAVFTAHVVQSIGGIYNLDGVRSSDRVIALVHHRYWGFPSYWPGIVILDGRIPCGLGFLEGEEYLVSAYRGSRYGVFEVVSCGRTQPLKTASVDLRTMDGSICSGPGGTLIGHVSYWTENQRGTPPVRNATLTFRDFYGKSYATHSDDEGIYELRHVPPGPYTLEPRIVPGQYSSGGGEVTSGVCKESPVYVSPYTVTGRLISGIFPHARVELIPVEGGSKGPSSVMVGLDGRFHFRTVSSGEYFMVARFELVGRDNQWSEVYYPGVNTPDKAAKIHVSDQTRAQSFDFSADALPLVSIPIFVDSPDPSHQIGVQIQQLDSGGRLVRRFVSFTGIPVQVSAVRGETYDISILDSDDQILSETVRVVATTGMKMTRIPLTRSR